MIAAPIPLDDEVRLQALREMLILDTPPEERFDRITRFAMAEFDVPIASIGLVDRDRQWMKSCIGVPNRESPRHLTICGHAILERDLLVVPDTLDDPRFHDNPLVTSAMGLRSYAGAVLRLPQGAAVGTLCVMDTRPREFDALDLAILCSLRELVVEELVRREGSA